jgi:hypothetical protein
MMATGKQRTKCLIVYYAPSSSSVKARSSTCKFLAAVGGGEAKGAGAVAVSSAAGLQATATLALAAAW